MNFTINMPAHIEFGPGCINTLPGIAELFGEQALIITGAHPERYESVFAMLKGSGISYSLFSIKEEPSIAVIDEISEKFEDYEIDMIIGIGGGSVIDAAKAASMMLVHEGSVLDYLEVIGKGKEFFTVPLPCFAIPTTAGTGSEATKNAVLYSDECKVKVSLRNEEMLPDVAFIDPELTLTAPPQVTAHTGMDALTQVIEPYISCRSNPFTDALCTDSIQKAVKALPEAYANSENIEARSELSYVGLTGGIALANAKLGAVHGFAGVLGGICKAPHGAVCAALLPSVLEINYKAVNERGNDDMKKKYQKLAQLICSKSDADFSEAVQLLKELSSSMKIKGLASLGVTEDLFAQIIGKAKRASSMKGNTLSLKDSELEEILRMSL